VKVTCARCQTEKDQRAFDRDASRESGRYPWCKLCRKKYSPNAQQDLAAPLNGHECPLCDTPIRGNGNRRYCSSYCRDRVAGLRKRFGLTVEQYRSMMPEDKRCPICGKRPRKWVVEHDHYTNLVTGLVCTGCNVGLLAHSKHDPELVRRLYLYLKDPPAERVIGQHRVPDDPDGKLRGKSKIHKRWGR
jgi:hypothetical protein